ncbi:helix-turn-helix domain-containing protein [Belnapia moabensis]|uniref:helix-turn-helix domain-containing protein n=1 Tax=Belnapia moabensis TaxID=365533 RepID=UPI0005BC36E2|nr:helix-turn-helix transcriptional regulator [Belnapia moabensis]
MEAWVAKQTLYDLSKQMLAEVADLGKMAREGIPHVPTPMTIAFFVRLQRELREWKQSELCCRADISLSTLERVERGQAVSPDNLRRIAIALGQAQDAFTEPRIPSTAEEALCRLEEKVKPFEDTVEVSVRPLRGHRQIAELAQADMSLLDAGRLDESFGEDLVQLREWLDLTGFLLAAEAEDSFVDLDLAEPAKRRQLYTGALDCVQRIERRGGAIALAGTYVAETGLPPMPKAKVAVVVFFHRKSDPGAAKRRTLYAPSHIPDAAWSL